MTIPKSNVSKMARIRAPLAFITAAFLTSTGCSSRPSAINPPDIDPSEMAAAAVEHYDANADGKIDRKELDSAPSLRFSVGRIDSNNDSQLTSEEIATFAQKEWVDREVGLIRVRCEVVANGRPVDGATVTLEPEPFMGGTVKPASGVTRDGIANLKMSADDTPSPNARGVQNGLYLVRISKVLNGKEQIPNKYNEQTTLGCEIADQASYMPGSVVFELSMR